jgi:prephenate dehydratase
VPGGNQRTLTAKAAGMVVAYQGAPGAFSEEAAIALAGAAATLVPCRSFEDVFATVARGSAQAAVVPVRNSVAGDVPGVETLVRDSGLSITGRLDLRVQQSLIGCAGAQVSDLRRVLSHPMAIAQCTRFFREHPHLIAVPAFDTSGAVRDVIRRGRLTDAAIASSRAAEIWGATVIETGIQDDPDNITEFVLLV